MRKPAVEEDNLEEPRTVAEDKLETQHHQTLSVEDYQIRMAPECPLLLFPPDKVKSWVTGTGGCWWRQGLSLSLGMPGF